MEEHQPIDSYEELEDQQSDLINKLKVALIGSQQQTSKSKAFIT
jgi:hypothetical protein